MPCPYMPQPFLGNNPQYTLQVHSPEHGATTWILLSRHITTKVLHALTVSSKRRDHMCFVVMLTYFYRVILPRMRSL